MQLEQVTHPCAFAGFPPEIWLNIIRFLSDDEVLALKTMNAVFFDAALDIRYKHIEISPYGEENITILRDLDIARRVRTLEVDLDEEPFDATILYSEKHTPSLSFSEIRQGLRDVVSGLTRLRQYKVRCAEKSTISADVQTLLCDLWDTVSQRVVEVSIHGLNASLNDIIPLVAPKLHHLFLYLDSSSCHSDAEALQQFMATRLSQVSSLTLDISWTVGKFTSLLSGLPTSVGLERIFLRMCDISLLDFLGGITAIMENQKRTLQHLLVVPNRSNFILYDAYEYGPEIFTWITERLEDTDSFKGLVSLSFFSFGVAAPFDLTAEYIRRAAPTLTDLAIFTLTHHDDYYFDYRSLDVITSLLGKPGMIQELELPVLVLTPQVVDLLSKRLPKLRKLVIKARYLMEKPSPGVHYKEYTHSLDHLSLQSKQFSRVMKDRQYPNWHLQALGVYVLEPFHDSMKEMPSVSQVVMGCVPSANGFFDQVPTLR